MLNIQHMAPFAVEIIANQAAMAVMGRRLRTKQAGIFEQVRLQRCFDAPVAHQFEKEPFILPPIAFLFFIGGQDVVGRRQKRLVPVLDVRNLFQEIRQVPALGEARQLGRVVQPDVQELFDARSGQTLEKIFRGRLGETNRRDRDGARHGPSAPVDFGRAGARRLPPGRRADKGDGTGFQEGVETVGHGTVHVA